jgi:hypothetical protein
MERDQFDEIEDLRERVEYLESQIKKGLEVHSLCHPSFVKEEKIEKRTEKILSDLGFVEMSDVKQVWTNSNSPWMPQVWVCLPGSDSDLDLDSMDLDSMTYDARKGFGLKDFFTWWEDVAEEYHAGVYCR